MQHLPWIVLPAKSFCSTMNYVQGWRGGGKHAQTRTQVYQSQLSISWHKRKHRTNMTHVDTCSHHLQDFFFCNSDMVTWFSKKQVTTPALPMEPIPRPHFHLVLLCVFFLDSCGLEKKRKNKPTLGKTRWASGKHCPRVSIQKRTNIAKPMVSHSAHDLLSPWVFHWYIC